MLLISAMKKAKSEHTFQQEIEGKSTAYKYLHRARQALRLSLSLLSLSPCLFPLPLSSLPLPLPPLSLPSLPLPLPC